MSNESPPFVAPPITAVNLKLPAFWANDPTRWFAQVDAQFLTQGITAQETKFAHVVASLQPEIAQEVWSILIEPPTERPYDSLKAEHIRLAIRHAKTLPSTSLFVGAGGS